MKIELRPKEIIVLIFGLRAVIADEKSVDENYDDETLNKFEAMMPNAVRQELERMQPIEQQEYLNYLALLIDAFNSTCECMLSDFVLFIKPEHLERYTQKLLGT